MLEDLDALALTAFHDERLADRRWAADRRLLHPGGLWRWVETNHLCNTLLWDEEDRARRTDVPEREIARSKRLIDQHNQRRNDAVESIDECLLHALREVEPLAGARLHSETAGSMVDRLSILSLKIHHMRAQTLRSDASVEHVGDCVAKLQRLIDQRRDLRACLDALLHDARRGTVYFKVYRQFKMYNDPSLNPYLYAAVPADAARQGAR